MESKCISTKIHAQYATLANYQKSLVLPDNRSLQGGGGTLSVTDGEVPPKSLRLQAVPEILLKMYTLFPNFLSF